MTLRPRLLVCALLVLPVVSCSGGDPEPTPGVEGLDNPTPSPDPDDFVDTIDNPWLPMPPEAAWTYETDQGGRYTVRATGPTKQIAGVTVSELRLEERTGPSVRWLAQDAAGNVWLFGASQGGESWEAGEDGARAALAMPAEPVEGESWVGTDAPGLDTELTAVEVDDERVVLEATNPDQPDFAVTTTYERETGPVLLETEGEDAVTARLVGFVPGEGSR